MIAGSRIMALSPERAPCPGFHLDGRYGWRQAWHCAVAFSRRHGNIATDCGWSDIELYGVHPIVGANRQDYLGAGLVGLHADEIHPDRIIYANRLVRPRTPVPTDAVLIWGFGLPQPGGVDGGA